MTKKSFATLIHSSIGSSIVEAAITLQLFLMILIIGSWLAIGAYKVVSLQYAIANSARWALLGKKIEYPAGSGINLSRELSIEYYLYTNHANLFGLDFGAPFTPGVNHPNIRICPLTNTACTIDDASTAQAFIEISAIQPFQIFLWNMIFTASAIAKNEPFSS